LVRCFNAPALGDLLDLYDDHPANIAV
jgi:hypothetical protein